MNHHINMKKHEMLNWIDSISLAVYDTALFLDTHPDDKEALEYFKHCSQLRNEALEEYAKNYGPLQIDEVNASDQDYWNWINQPWPWDLGGC